MSRNLALVALCAFALVACNMTKFTANTTSKVIEVASNALNQENDIELAREAAPGSLKTIEGFLMASPENEIFLATLAEGYCNYTFGFIESDVEEARWAGKSELEAKLTARATNLYLRCMNYGLKLLGDGWDKDIHGDLRAFESRVRNAKADHVKGMFWTALGLASAINLNKDDIDMVAYLPKAKILLERVVALDPNFNYGLGHMALGMLAASLPKALGGDPEGARKHFDSAMAATSGKFLIPKVMMGITLGTQSGDRKFFHDTLVQVLATSPAVFPDQRLGNELAHVKAKRYLAHEKELF
ncbi:MAG TPA: TRAP transporter TatT component family protein [Haliangiales bacterium]|nr:TRAP transporter TatT component family protein [Haliangiales bacterium]